MTVLRAEDLRVTYSTKGGDVPAVRGVSFSIDRGEVLGLAGESGCGKSTIAGVILRLHSPNTKIEGTLELEGQDILSLKPGRLRAVRWTGASIIVPHDLDFGSPSPRKDSCDSDRIAIAIVRIVFAKITGIRFGVMCLITTCASLAPSARDRSM